MHVVEVQADRWGVFAVFGAVDLPGWVPVDLGNAERLSPLPA
jgi:hypothetical protein